MFKILNKSKEVEQIVIQYKDLFFEITLDKQTGEPTGDFGWSTDPTNLSVNLRDIIKVNG